MSRRRARALRLLGLGLVLYGAVGTLLFAGAANGITGPFDAIGQLGESLERQRSTLLLTLRTTSDALDDAARGIDGVDDSLAQAQEATDQAAAIADDTSFTMSEVSRAMQLEILGSQPFLGIAGGFDRAAGQLTALGVELRQIGSALDQNADDATRTASDVRAIGDTIEELRGSLSRGPQLEVPTAELGAARLLLHALLAWLAILAIGCFVAGLFVWRHARSSNLI